MFLERTEKYKKYNILASTFLTTSLIALVFLLGFKIMFDWLFLDYIVNFFKGIFILGLIFELIPEILEKNKGNIILGMIFIIGMTYLFFGP